MILRIKSDTTANETDYFKGRSQDFVQQSSISGSASFAQISYRPPRISRYRYVKFRTPPLGTGKCLKRKKSNYGGEKYA